MYVCTSNNMKLLHWPLMGGLLHLVQRGGDWAGPQPAQAPLRCTKCNGHAPINGQSLYCCNGPLFCGFNMPIKAAFHYSTKLQTWLSTCVSVSKARRKQVESMSKACRKPTRTCRKPGCKPGRKPGLQPGLQLARITECGLKGLT